jgi:hypothetical protein
MTNGHSLQTSKSLLLISAHNLPFGKTFKLQLSTHTRRASRQILNSEFQLSKPSPHFRRPSPETVRNHRHPPAIITSSASRNPHLNKEEKKEVSSMVVLKSAPPPFHTLVALVYCRLSLYDAVPPRRASMKLPRWKPLHGSSFLR